MKTTTENLNTTLTTPLGDHINRNREEGLPFQVYEYEDYVSVETSRPFDNGSPQIDLYYKSTGKKITRPEDWRNILHTIIREG